MDTSKQELLNEGCLFFTLYMGAPLGSCSIHYQRLVNFSFLPTYLCLNSLPSLDTYQSGCWLICENQTKGSWRLISTSSIPHELWSICGNQLMFLVTQCWKLNYPFFFHWVFPFYDAFLYNAPWFQFLFQTCLPSPSPLVPHFLAFNFSNLLPTFCI